MVKNWIETLNPSTPVLWLAGKDIAQNQPSDLAHLLHLNHPLDEVATALTSPTAYCVIDGAGSIVTEEGYGNLVALIKALRVGEEGSAWRFLLVCQQEEWNRVFLATCRVQGKQIDWEKGTVEEPNDEELTEVWRTFPQLLPLAMQRELKPLLSRPKILDLIACRLALGAFVSTTEWVGESSVALWFWENEVASPPAMVSRSQIMMRVAELQADMLSPEVSVNSLPSEVDTLINDRLLTSDGRSIAFQHDLYGDWARLQILIGQETTLTAFVNSKLGSPFWNRAVRLYGVYLLEHDKSTERWKTTLDQFAETASGGNLGQDLILEAVIYAANPLPLLEAIWPYLKENDGKLLQRLLGRFLYTATDPNALYLELAKSKTDEIRYSTKERRPYWPHWLPMLEFLHAHKDEVIHLAPFQIAEVARTWLQFTPTNWPQRKNASELAIALAEDVLAHEWTYNYVNKETQEQAFSAALAAINELPDQVRDFALRASGRKKRPDRHVQAKHDIQPLQRQSLPFPSRRRRENVTPWPDGPLQSPNESFKKVCFETSALFPIIQAAPDLAEEVLLALLINTPHEYYESGADPDYPLPGSECEIDELNSHYPPFYWHLPWLTFLRVHPKHAIDTIVRLVNFATDRWEAFLARRHRESMHILIHTADEERGWKGDMQTYFWYTGAWGPDTVSSVLMTLEFWLYEQIASGNSVEEHIAQIVETSRSIAFAGVLAAVACKHNDLLKGPLRFLMAIPEFLYMERQKAVRVSANTAMISWTMQGEEARQKAQEWHTMPHRAQGLDSVAYMLLIEEHVRNADPELRSFFEEVRKEWKTKAEALRRNDDQEGADLLERLVSTFTPEHYSAEYSEEHQGVLIAHHFPQELEERSRPELEKAEFGFLRTTFPMRCRRILNGDVSLNTDSEIEALWANCQQIIAAPNESFDPVLMREDATCGAAAVLLLKYGDWVHRYREREVWCCEQILSTIERPPQVHQFDSDDDVSDCNWHSFCAEAIPTLWLQNLSSSRLRSCILLMALDRHYRTIGILFGACYPLRQQLGEQFFKLQALLRYWALEKPDMWHRENVINGGFILRREEHRSLREILALGKRQRSKLLSKQFLQSMAAFVDNSLPPALPSLIKLDQPPKPELWFQGREDYDRRRGRYDVAKELIQWAYSYLPALNNAHDPQERAQWIKQWREILECLLRTLQPLSAEDRDKEVGGTPCRVEFWMLGSVSILITQMTQGENPEQFWQPILDLGWQAHHWVEHFLTSFFNQNLYKTDEDAFRRRFVRLWSEMIDYADAAEGWNNSTTSRGWNVSEIWECLMGLSGYSAVSWKDQHQPILQDMRDRFQMFCDRHMGGYRTVAKFLRLLSLPAAKSIRLDALRWAEPHLAEGRIWDRHEDIEGCLSSLLAECWQNQQAELRQSPETFECFKRLLKLLADRQNTMALEIQNRIISG
jgi:hypothetical protein